MSRSLIWPFVILVLISVISLCIATIPGIPKGWWQDLSLNIFAEILGIILAVILIDRVIHQKETADKEERLVKGLQALPPQMLYFLNVVIIIANVKKAQSEFTLAHLTSENFWTSIDSADLSHAYVDHSVSEKNNIPRFEMLMYSAEITNKIVDTLLARYSDCMTIEEISLLETILRCAFSRIVGLVPSTQLRLVREIYEKKYGWDDGLVEPLREYTMLLQRLIVLYNKHTTTDRQITFDSNGHLENKDLFSYSL